MTTSPDDSRAERDRDRYAFRIAMAAAIGGFLFGYDISIISGAIMFLKSEFNLDEYQQGFAVSSAALGCIFGPMVAGAISDKIGRRGALGVAAVLLFVASLGTAIPNDMTTFNVFRILGGVGVGVASIVTPMYIAEMAPARLRGRLVSVNQLAVVTGLFCAVVVSYAFSFQGSWRWMFGSECFPALVWIGVLFTLPESPRWLVEKGREAEALALLVKSEGPAQSNVAIAEIKQSMAEEVGDWSELFQPGMRMALLVAVMLAIFQQVTGVSILLIYAPTIFESAGFNLPSSAIAQAIYLGIWNIFCTAVAFWLVDRWGRRPLLLLGTAAMSVALFFLGLCFQFHWTGYIVVAMMFLCVSAYLSSLAPLAWLIMSEIFPTRVRGRAMSIAGVSLWAACFAASQMFPVMWEYCDRRFGSPAGVFWLFAAVCLVALLFSWRLVPETKGRTLEAIAASWK